MVVPNIVPFLFDNGMCSLGSGGFCIIIVMTWVNPFAMMDGLSVMLAASIWGAGSRGPPADMSKK